MSCSGFCDTVLDVRVSCKVCLCTRIATECECLETTLRSGGKIPRMKWSLNEVPGMMSTTRCGTTPNQVQVLSLPRRGWRSINFSRHNGCLLVARRCGTSLRPMRLVQIGGIVDGRVRVTPVPVSKRQFTMCLTETKIIYVTQSL